MQQEIIESLNKIKDVSQFEVRSNADFEQCALVLKQVKELRKMAEAKRVELTKPLLDHKKKIDDEFKRYIDAYDHIITGINAKLVSYQRAEEKKRAEEIARIEAERRAEEEKLRAKLEVAKTDKQRERLENKIADVQFAPPPSIVEPSAQGLSFREVYSFEVEDVNAIPREFMIPNDTAIGAFIRTTKGNVNIAGIKIIVNKTAVSK
jgi:hypothetical protein